MTDPELGKASFETVASWTSYLLSRGEQIRQDEERKRQGITEDTPVSTEQDSLDTPPTR